MPPRFRDWPSLDGAMRRTLRVQAVARARALEPSLNAYVSLCDGMADPQSGALDGMPYAAKDIFAAPDRRPCGGLALPLPHLDDVQADVLRLLDQAGGFRVGHTALTEIAYEPSGYNAVHGRVRNPWNFDFISGGSSSGSAAAVASGSAVIALGSDTGGSLRIPAHVCGVTAWKPSYGVVSTRGAMPLAPTLDTIGLLARSAADMMPGVDALARDLPLLAPIRRAVVLSDIMEDAHPSVRQACQNGIDAIAASGVTLYRRDGGAALEAADEPVFTIMQGEASRCHRGLIDDETISPVLRRRLAKGLDIDDQTLAAAVAQRTALADAFIEILGRADVAILPVMAIRTPLAAECDPQSPSFRARTLYELSRLTRFVNMLGLPAVALPVGFDDQGLPVALQIVGRAQSDRALLALAAMVQSCTVWHGRVPDAVSSVVRSGDPPDIA